LRELRKHQQIPLRRFERDFVNVMAQVLSVDLPSSAFDPSGWRIEFGESQTPLTRADRLNVFLAERTAGVSNTVEYLEETRGMDVEESLDHMIRCQVVELFRNQLMRPLMAMSGAAMGGAPQPAAVVQTRRSSRRRTSSRRMPTRTATRRRCLCHHDRSSSFGSLRARRRAGHKLVTTASARRATFNVSPSQRFLAQRACKASRT
jgi:hypothetical protein